MQEIVEGVSRELHARGENEYPSTLIGELLMNALKSLDKVAYIRFASVYRSFEDLSSFQAEIAELAGGNE
jgi:transcriptional repressor NrdR